MCTCKYSSSHLMRFELGHLAYTIVSATRRSFATALVLLERSSVQGSLAPAVTTFLTEQQHRLQTPFDPFPRADQAKKDLQSGQLVVKSGAAAAKTKVDQNEQQLSLQVAERFNLDETESLVALRSFNAEGRRPETHLSEDDWDALTAYVFEERMAVIGIVAWLLRSRQCPWNASLSPLGVMLTSSWSHRRES